MPEPDATNRLVIMICIIMATLMQTLDSTIANVALPYMQGSLSASSDQITWVLTSYVVAAAVLTAPVGWLTLRFGRKRVFLVCLIGFTVTSMACGLATSLPQMVLDRLLQGAFGAALVPLSQSTLLDIYPPKQRAVAMSFWGMGVMIGPILGPTVGGYLTSYYNWRFVFFVNLPLGIITILGLLLLMPGGDAKKSTRFDWIGFGTLSLGLSAFQFMLDRGEELDWFSSGTVITATVVAALGFYLFLVHMMMAENPFISRAVFADRNFNGALFILFSVGLVVLASSALLPPYLEKLANFPVASTGLILAPRGFGVMAAMLIAGRLGNSTDPRLIVFTGYVLLGISMEMIEGWTDAVSVNFMVETVTLQGFGLGLIFTPLQTAAFYTLPAPLRTQGAALLSLVRNFGSSIGVAITSAILVRQAIYEHAVLAQNVTPFTRPLLRGAAAQMMNPETSGGASLLDSIINTQSQIIAYIDVYKFLMLISIPAMFCLFIMRPSGHAARAGTRAEAMVD